MVLICFSLVVSGTEQLFTCLLVISISFLEKKICFRSSFLIGLFVLLLLSCMTSLYILDVTPLLDI